MLNVAYSYLHLDFFKNDKNSELIAVPLAAEVLMITSSSAAYGRFELTTLIFQGVLYK